MKKYIKFFVKNHIFADLLTVIVIAFGLYAMFNIRRIVFPNVKFEVITVNTIYPGATPEEVEKLISSPIEQDLKEVDGIKKIQSTSIEGLSSIVIYVDPDQTTEEKAKEDVKDVIAKLDPLPAGAEAPKVTTLESKNEPIIEVAIYGNVPDMKLREQALFLEKELENIPGVSKVSLQGERELEIRVEADINSLSRWRVTLDELIMALRAQNISVPAGSIQTKSTEKIVRVVGDFVLLKDIENTVIRANELGQSIRVKDIAKVRYELEKAKLYNRLNGLPAVNLTVAKKEKADAIDMVALVKTKMAELSPRLDPAIKYEFVNDMSVYIENRLSIVTNNLIIGLLCVLIILPFLLPFRFAFLVALGEPFAFLGAILVLYWFDQSINLISMIGLIIVSGILVDDSIVVTENAVRRIENGEHPREAAIKGTLQIFGPLTASVATTGIVFLPMAYMSGIFGKFIVEIPIAVLTCLIVSLFETYLILPAHIAHWIKPKGEIAAARKKGFFSSIGNAFAPIAAFFTQMSARSSRYWEDKIETRYIHILRYMLNRRYIFMGLSLTFFVFSCVAGFFYAKKHFILFPPDGIEIFFIRTEAANGTSLDKHTEHIKIIENFVARLPKTEVVNFVSNVGIQQQDPHDPFTRRGSEFAQLAVYLTPENSRDRTAQEIIEALRKEIGTPKEFVDVRFDRLNPGPPTGKAISLGVRGEKFEDIMPAVNDLKKRLSAVDGVIDIDDSYVLGKEELQIVVDPYAAASAGLSVQNVGFTARAAIEGHIATTVKTLNDDIDVRVSLPQNETQSIDVINDIFVPNNLGNLVPLKQISSIKNGQGLLMVQHEANQRQINVSAGVDTEKTTSIEVNAMVREWLSEINKNFPKISVAFGGEDQDTQESFVSLGRTFLVALAGVYLVLVLAFGNLYQPTIVMLTVPMGLVSVLWAFIFHGLPISFMGCLGAVALTGVIVNNAIVLVDFINQNKNSNLSFMECVLVASKDRMRPIFLTTITTVVGVLPTAYGIGGLDKFVVPIAMSLGWGLIFGALLTTFIFPLALTILEDIRSIGKKSELKSNSPVASVTYE